MINNVVSVSGVNEVIYIHLFIFRFFSQFGCCRVLGRVPWAAPKALVGYPPEI